jgi:hypothetical protein
MIGEASTTGTAAGEVEEFLTRGRAARNVDGDLAASRRWSELAYGAAERTGDVPATGAVTGDVRLTAPTPAGTPLPDLERSQTREEPGSSATDTP